MSISKITILESNAPNNMGLAELPPIPENTIVSGKPVQHGYRYYEEPETGFRAGIWACTAFQSITEPHAVHEFMHLIEGSVTIVHEDGSELVVNAGEQFFIPKGAIRSWKQTGSVKKYYMIFPDPSNTPPGSSGPRRAFKIETGGDAAIFKDATDQYSIGVWTPAAEGRDPKPIAATEMLIPLEGSLALRGADADITVAPGEVALAPADAPFGWKSSGPVKVLYCAYERKK